MNNQPSRPAVFCPAAGQRRWVRDRRAAIRGHRGWVHFVRVDQPHQVMVEAPYDHESVGEWERHCRSVWQCPAVGASFPSIAAAAAWVQQIPRV
jgi:hypothetical protein